MGSRSFLGLVGVVSASLLGLLGCLSQEQRILASVERHVAKQMLAPESARFTGGYVVFGPETNGTTHATACGYVAGKNAFGGYAPKTRYTATVITGSNILDISNIQIEPSDRSATVDSQGTGRPETVFEKVYWNRKCIDSGHPPTYSGT